MMRVWKNNGKLFKRARLFGFRRKRTLADRVQDVAERAVDKAVDAVQDVSTVALESVVPVLARPGRMAFRAADRARGAYDVTLHSVSPIMVRTSGAAGKALSRTADTAASSVETVGEVATTAAATTAAAAGAVAAFFGALFSWLWWGVKLSLKTAVLAAVAYAGWQWLKSQRESRFELSSTYAPNTSPSGTYGNVAPAFPERPAAVGR